MTKGLFQVFCLLTIVGSMSDAQDPELDLVFDPKVLDGFQRRYKVDVAAKSEECFFLSAEQGQKFNFHFMVINVDSRGNKLDIVLKILAPGPTVFHYESRKTEGKLIGKEIPTTGDLEICFINRYSVFESKRVFWQFEIEGARDEIREEEQAINQNLEEFSETSKEVRKTVMRVRSKVSRIKHQQWRTENAMKKDIARAEAIQGMIDRWSVYQVFLVVGIGIAQVVMLRKLFNVKPGSHNLAMRT